MQVFGDQRCYTPERKSATAPAIPYKSGFLPHGLLSGTTVYLTTPFVGGEGGGELFDWIADNHELPASEAVIRPLLHQVVDGMRVRQVAERGGGSGGVFFALPPLLLSVVVFSFLALLFLLGFTFRGAHSLLSVSSSIVSRGRTSSACTSANRADGRVSSPPALVCLSTSTPRGRICFFLFAYNSAFGCLCLSMESRFTREA